MPNVKRKYYDNDMCICHMLSCYHSNRTAYGHNLIKIKTVYRSSNPNWACLQYLKQVCSEGPISLHNLFFLAQTIELCASGVLIWSPIIAHKNCLVFFSVHVQ